MNNGLIILDFDGTLCDTRQTIVKTLQMTMEKLCLPVVDEYACAATIGLPLSVSFKTLFPSLTEEQTKECRIFLEMNMSLWLSMWMTIADSMSLTG